MEGHSVEKNSFKSYYSIRYSLGSFQWVKDLYSTEIFESFVNKLF